MALLKICSGAQSGADLGALATAKKFGIATGGIMPKGWITTAGPRPEYAQLYNMREHTSSNYVPRTYENVLNADGTIRLAFNFNSPGEICTLKAIHQYNKPWIDVDLNDPRPSQEVVDWILNNNIETLNVAGNSERTYVGTNIATSEYLTEVFKLLGFKESSC
jgi:hypothetical protein